MSLITYSNGTRVLYTEIKWSALQAREFNEAKWWPPFRVVFSAVSSPHFYFIFPFAWHIRVLHIIRLFVTLGLYSHLRCCFGSQKKKTTSETASHCLLVVILVRAVVWLRTRPRIVCYGAKVTRHHTQSHTTNVTQETRKKRREIENIRAHDDTTNWATRENSTNIGQ